MEFEVMISHFNKHNEISLSLCKEMNIKKIIIIFSPEKKDKIQEIRALFKKFLHKCIVLDIIIEEGNYKKITSLLEKYKNEKVIINLNNDLEINSFIFLNEAYKYNMKCIYVDIDQKKRYIFEKDIKVIEDSLDDISITSMAEFSGNTINHDEDDLAAKEDIIKISRIICENLSIWKLHKKKLFDKNIMIHDKMDEKNLLINTIDFNKEELNLLENILEKLKKINEIDYKKIGNKVDVRFKNDYLKNFIFKIGTWLEVLTNSVIKEIREIDDVKTSVEFYWNLQNKQIKNELDVLAIKDCVMICISCKDSNKYDEDALNELEVYGEKIGGKDAIKILVATDYPVKTSVIERAREMNIHLVIINENINEFKNKLIRIIEKKQ